MTAPQQAHGRPGIGLRSPPAPGLRVSGCEQSEHRSTHQEQHILCMLRCSDLKANKRPQASAVSVSTKLRVQGAHLGEIISQKPCRRALLGRLGLAVRTQSHRQHETLGEVGHTCQILTVSNTAHSSLCLTLGLVSAMPKGLRNSGRHGDPEQ